MKERKHVKVGFSAPDSLILEAKESADKSYKTFSAFVSESIRKNLDREKRGQEDLQIMQEARAVGIDPGALIQQAMRQKVGVV